MVPRCLLSALMVLLLALPAVAQDGCPRRRNVDCAGAARAIAAAVAADPALARLDAGILAREAALRSLLDPPVAAALARDLATSRAARARDLFFLPDGAVEEDSRDILRLAMEAEMAHLARIDPAPPQGFAGRWASRFVTAEVVPLGAGRYGVSAGAVEPFHLAWTCEFDDEARPGPDGVLLAEGGELRLRRTGPLLRLEPLPRPGRAGFDHCGAMGSLRGALFYLGAIDQNPTQADR